jgi:hypothetical protein
MWLQYTTGGGGILFTPHQELVKQSLEGARVVAHQLGSGTPLQRTAPSFKARENLLLFLINGSPPSCQDGATRWKGGEQSSHLQTFCLLLKYTTSTPDTPTLGIVPRFWFVFHICSDSKYERHLGAQCYFFRALALMTAQSLDIASFLLKKMHRSQLPVYIFIFLQFLLTELFWKAYAGLPFDSIWCLICF